MGQGASGGQHIRLPSKCLALGCGDGVGPGHHSLATNSGTFHSPIIGSLRWVGLKTGPGRQAEYGGLRACSVTGRTQPPSHPPSPHDRGPQPQKPTGRPCPVWWIDSVSDDVRPACPWLNQNGVSPCSSLRVLVSNSRCWSCLGNKPGFAGQLCALG